MMAIKYRFLARAKYGVQIAEHRLEEVGEGKLLDVLQPGRPLDTRLHFGFASFQGCVVLPASLQRKWKPSVRGCCENSFSQ